MVGGWSIREARKKLFKLYQHDSEKKKLLYSAIGSITTDFDMNVVTPAEDGDDDNGDTNTDVCDSILLFLKIYNQGGLTYPTITVRAWVYSFFQYMDECFNRLSKSSSPPEDLRKDLEQRLVDICIISWRSNDVSSCKHPCKGTISIIKDICKIMVSKLTNCRNGMLLRHYLGKQNILTSEKVHIRQKLAAYSIVSNKPKQQAKSGDDQSNNAFTSGGGFNVMEDEMDDDNLLDLSCFQTFNEVEEFYLNDIGQCVDEEDYITAERELSFSI